MNSKQLFEIALGDNNPWQVTSIDFEVGESGNKELHIRLDFPAENKDNFMNMILFTCGKLNFKYSPI